MLFDGVKDIVTKQAQALTAHAVVVASCLNHTAWTITLRAEYGSASAPLLYVGLFHHIAPNQVGGFAFAQRDRGIANMRADVVRPLVAYFRAVTGIKLMRGYAGGCS
jgi:hypothetical protein